MVEWLLELVKDDKTFGLILCGILTTFTCLVAFLLNFERIKVYFSYKDIIVKSERVFKIPTNRDSTTASKKKESK